MAKSGITHGAIIESSDIMQPVEIQGHIQTTVQTHSGVTVAPTGSGQSAWIDSLGFDKVAVTFLNDAGTASSLSIQWSNDGATVQGYESLIPSSTVKEKSGIVETKARYFKVLLWNNDSAAPHVMSAWAYLKA